MRGVSETSLLATQASATALRLFRSVERASVATTTATAVVAATATTIVVVCEPVGWGAAKIAWPTCGPGTVFSDIEP
jgi:hypothetical protein